MYSKESIKEYQKILSRHCGVELSEHEAQLSADALLRLYTAVFNSNKVSDEKSNQTNTY